MKINDVISGIHTWREKVHTEAMWNDPVRLSDAMLRLATYNAYLADELAPLHKAATDKAYQVFTEVKADGGSVSQAENMSRGESTREREMYENILNVYRATDNLISVMQSRVRVAENTLKREGMTT